MSSVGATFCPSTTLTELVIGLVHRCSGMKRGIGERSMQTGSFPSCVLSLTHRSHRFVDCDTFARFAGIGIGCQWLQASNVLEISVGPDPPDPPVPGAPFEDGINDDRFKDCYTIDPEDSDMEDGSF